MGEKAAAEKLRDFLGPCNGIARLQCNDFGLERKNFSSDEMAEGEFTDQAFFAVMMAVIYLVFPLGVFVVALFFGKLLFQMPERIQRLEQYREQYRCTEAKLDKCRMSFH